MNRRYAAMGVIALGVAVWCGCAQKDPIGRRPVTGKVTVDGQPAPAGNIIFDPGANGLTLSGALISNGSYQVPGDKGLVPGVYTVSVSVPDPTGRTIPRPNAPPLLADLVPPNSQRKITVTADGPNVFDFDFKSK